MLPIQAQEFECDSKHKRENSTLQTIDLPSPEEDLCQLLHHGEIKKWDKN